jgi:peptidoglycan hydrolase CwlO-like protein
VIFPKKALALAAAAVACFTLLSPPAPASAESISEAEARVERLQGELVRTTTQLTEGTRRWEADQSRLRLVQAQLRSTQRRVAAAAQEVAAVERQLNSVARQLYMSPSPDRITLAVTRGPAEFASSVQSLGALDRAADSQRGVMHQAAVTRHRLRVEEAKVTALTADARALAERSSTQLRELNARAQAMSDRLSSAQSTLRNARAAAAAEAARRAAADRARQLAAQRQARVIVSGGPLCTGKPIGNQQNGNLDPESLCKLWMGGGATLRADAANAFNRMSKYRAATAGGPLCVTGGYRSYQRQVELYRSKPGLAAVPGTSEHGWGQAVDLCGGVQTFGTAAHEWMRANAGRFGWVHPEWARQSGSRPEAWHWEYVG